MVYMTTVTQAGIGFEIRAIAPDVVRQLLARDDAGSRPRLLTDNEGGSPLRCCLRPSEPDERIALVSYAPLRRWARETGTGPGPTTRSGQCSCTPGLALVRTALAIQGGSQLATECSVPTARTGGYSADC